MYKPIISILGRPNVGKSTLFNRLVGKRKSIVSPIHGVTRDRIYGEFEWLNQKYSLIDTGGYIPRSDNIVDQQVNFQAEIAKENSDLIIFMVDGKEEITSSDHILSDIIKKSGKPHILAINKIDTKKNESNLYEYYELGLGEPVYISAQEGRQVGLVLDLINKNFPPKLEESEIFKKYISLAIIGMPNVGKSSLMNNLIKEEKSIVTNIAGTTRDSVDSYIKYKKQDFRLIDTAGLRKRSKIDDSLEFYSTVRTYRVIEDCSIVAILIDANKGFHSQDKNLINYVIEKGKGLIIVINKWDLIEKDTYTMKNFQDDIIYEYPNLQYYPMIFISVKNNLRVTKVLESALDVYQKMNQIIKTNDLNKFLKKTTTQYPPPSVNGKEIKMKYISQLKMPSPVFLIHSNYIELIPESYKRYLLNQIKENYDFNGVAIKIKYKSK